MTRDEESAIGSFRYFVVINLVVAAFYSANFVTGGAFVFLSIPDYATNFIGTSFCWNAFRYLSRVDGHQFRWPKRLTLGYLIGLPIITVGLFGIQPFYVPTRDLTTLAIGLFLLIGLLLALLGLIGQIVGMWRIGRRYDNISIKQGSILFFVPVVGIVGSGLLLRGSLKLDDAKPKALSTG